MSEKVLVKRKGLGSLKADLLVSKPFTYLLLARVISRFGDSIDSIAYSWMVYMLTGSKVLMGTLFALNYVPNLLFSFFAGTLVDRWPKKIVIVATCLGRGILVTLTALMYWKGLLAPWHLYIFTLLISTLECFTSPAEMALVPQLLPKEKLLRGNSISTSASRVAELAGMAAAGGIIAYWGISHAILIDGLTFMAAAALLAFIRISPDSLPPTNQANSSFFQEIQQGLRYLRANKLILIIIFTAAYVNFCLSPYNVLNAVYVNEILRSGPEGLSLLGISLIIGMIASGLWIGKKGDNFKKSQLIITGYCLLGSNYALLYVPAIWPLHPLYPAAACCFGMGLAISLINTPATTYFMESVPKELLGRVGALNNLVCTCAIPLGSALAGVMGEWMLVHRLYLVFGICLLLPVVYLLKQRKFMSI
ncbi:MFS transporter [Paenibacillus macerans]|uniref:MFS transporter n=1 Tax=Paenibacillus macerans TaxID=44252 RepID=UPI0020414536|nr:MFS transporter [Paenibacillus macerans]MCM3699960.1 MFS transporter [Paenibacillus macerans]